MSWSSGEGMAGWKMDEWRAMPRVYGSTIGCLGWISSGFKVLRRTEARCNGVLDGHVDFAHQRDMSLR